MNGLQRALGCLILVVGVFFIYYAVSFLVVTKPDRTARSAGELEIKIANDVPTGASASQVIAFLDANKLSHEEQPDEHGILLSSAPSNKWTVMGETRIIISFAFENGKLSRWSVIEKTFSP